MSVMTCGKLAKELAIDGVKPFYWSLSFYAHIFRTMRAAFLV